MMDELMEADEWIEDEWIEEEEWIEDSWMELEKARGEKVIKCSKRKIIQLQQKHFRQFLLTSYQIFQA